MGQSSLPGLYLRRFRALFLLHELVFAVTMAPLPGCALRAAFQHVIQTAVSWVLEGMSTGSSYCTSPALETNVVFLILLS